MGKRIGKADDTIWEGTSNEKKTAGWTKSSHDKVAARTRQSWKKYDIKKRQKERVANQKTLGTREVSLPFCLNFFLHSSVKYQYFVSNENSSRVFLTASRY